MSTLVTKTRGDSPPDGKPRVYFCAHPKDLPLLDEISKDIFTHADCTIYYDPQPTADLNLERKVDLEEMQLFLVPITSNLVREPNRAMDEEFPFAREKGIPVLPLMQEDGLIGQFNRKTGCLQYLYKRAPNPDGIPYQEKLKQYLDRILVSSDLTTRIRNSFNAHLFLSYRKKDRTQAKRLMSTIHKSDAYRDVSIWYDDFLTPGESFTEEIQTALEGSKVFLLSVTPSLLERTANGGRNYIARKEYPAARRAGIPILPAELEKTDRNALTQDFPSLPPCVKAQDHRLLLQALQEKWKHSAPKNLPPERRFLIGLAYLNGIGMEVDRTLARKFLTEAAGEGLPEAMEQLVSLDRSSGNYLSAVEWQKKLVQRLQKTYQKTKDQEEGTHLAHACMALGDYQYELRQLPEARQTYDRMRRVSEKLIESAPSAQRLLCWSFLKLGRNDQESGDLNKARENYQEAMRLGKAEGLPAAVAACCSKLGHICQSEGKWEEAAAHYQMAAEIEEALVRRDGDTDLLLSLSISYDDQGNLYRNRQETQKAKMFYQKALSLREQAAEQSGQTYMVRNLLTVSYNKMAMVSIQEGNIEEIQRWTQKTLEACTALAEETGTLESRRNLSVAYERMGDSAIKAGQAVQAREWYEKCLNEREALCQEAQTIEARKFLGIIFRKMGYLSRKENDLEKAKRWFERARDEFETLLRETEDEQIRQELAYSQRYLEALGTIIGKTPLEKASQSQGVWNGRPDLQTKTEERQTLKRFPAMSSSKKPATLSDQMTALKTLTTQMMLAQAQQGDASGQYEMGLAYASGFGGMPKDYEKSCFWFQKAAAQGHMEAQYELGLCYENGRGVDANGKKALSWYRKAARQGHTDAKEAVRLLERALEPVLRLRMGLDRQARQRWKALFAQAKKGDTDAQMQMAAYYSNGKEIQPDACQTVFWYRKAAGQGCVEAQYQLGRCYEEGFGAVKSDDDPFFWYQKAAEQRDRRAQAALGRLYFTRGSNPLSGGEEDLNQAILWYQRAAEQGDPDAEKQIQKCRMARLKQKSNG